MVFMPQAKQLPEFLCLSVSFPALPPDVTQAWAAKDTAPPELDQMTESWIQKRKSEVYAPYLNNTIKTKHPRKIKNAIKETMMDYAGPIPYGKGIKSRA